jgi:hypothetical protein
MILQVLDIVSMRRKNWVIGATMFGRKISYRPPANPGACSRMNPVIRVGGSPSAKYERQEDRKKCVEYLVVMNMCTVHLHSRHCYIALWSPRPLEGFPW